MCSSKAETWPRPSCCAIPANSGQVGATGRRNRHLLLPPAGLIDSRPGSRNAFIPAVAKTAVADHFFLNCFFSHIDGGSPDPQRNILGAETILRARLLPRPSGWDLENPWSLSRSDSLLGCWRLMVPTMMGAWTLECLIQEGACRVEL